MTWQALTERKEIEKLIRLLTYQALALLAIAVLALLPHRESGRSALYQLALTVSEVISKCAAVLPALASVIEKLPARLTDEWRLERARDSFESAAAEVEEIGRPVKIR